MAGQATSSSLTPLMLEDVNSMIPILVEDTDTLDARIKDAKSVRVSTKLFRIRIQTGLTSNVAKVPLDGGAMPSGGASTWDQFTVTPLSYAVSIQYTTLADLTGEPGNVASMNGVTKSIADAALSVRIFRDKFLQTGGNGVLATVDVAANYTAGNNPIVLASTPFGARLLAQNQRVQVMNAAQTVVRGGGALATILNTNNILGSTQSIQVDNVPAGTTNGDVIVVEGVATGGDPFINGIPVFHSTALTGTLMGLSRSNNYVVANGTNAGGAQITLPVLRLAQNQILQALGPKGLKDQIWHTHQSQKAALEEIGFGQFNVFSSGKAKDYDPMFSGDMTIDTREILVNPHADQTRWDLINLVTWGKVKWGNPPFLLKNRGGQTVFQGYDPVTGNPQSVEKQYLLDAIQFYVDNPKSISSVTNCKVPVSN